MRYTKIGQCFGFLTGSVMLFLGGCASQVPQTQQLERDAGRYAVVKSGDWDQLSFGDFYTVNNVWGKGKLKDYRQWLYRADSTKVFPLGWKWSWPKTRVEEVKAYPSLSCGQTPWSGASTYAALPAKISQISNLGVEFDLRQRAKGKYNLAFDMWITKFPGNTESPEINVSREIMIWLDRKGFDFPKVWFVATLIIDDESYDFYRAVHLQTTSYWRDFLVFIKRQPRYSGKLNLGSFLDYLLSHGYVQESEYFNNIDLGSELWYGDGEVQVNSFRIIMAR